MRSPDKRIRPEANRTDSENTGRRSGSTIPTDTLAALTDDFVTGYQWGYVAGIETGRQQMDEELATIQRTAAEVVHKMAGLDSWDDHAAKVRQRQQEAAERFRSACAPIREREAGA